MRLRRLICSLIFCVALLNLACDSVYGITAAKIKDILDHPRDYQSQDITVSGTVTNAYRFCWSNTTRSRMALAASK